MDKANAASAPPPTFNDAPPPYPGTVNDYGQPYAAGGFQQVPQAGPPPAQYGLPPTQAGAPVQQVIVVTNPKWGKHAMNVTCPHCQCQILTETKSEPGPLAWILGAVLCFTAMWCCACIPCCIDDLNQVEHSCPSCKHFLGRYKGGL